MTVSTNFQINQHVNDLRNPRTDFADEAAFIKNWSIFNQIDLINRMTELCEIMGQNGAIITLDQEKACDKIRHDYLWRVLEKMNIPTNLITTIKSLYTGAKTAIILNGEMSKKFPVTRGVRQGDPPAYCSTLQ